MLQDNLKALRKSKGLTQEDMAERLHVVRQTVSKWEKGLSVPDAEMLIRIAELFEVSVSELLGGNIEECGSENAIAKELAHINEQLAIKNRRAKKIWQIILGSIIAIAVLTVTLVVIFSVDPNSATTDVTEVTKPIVP